MAVFAYRVARPDGSTLEGQIEGDEEPVVRAKLESQGLLIFQLKRRGMAPGRPMLELSAFRGLPLAEFLIFNQELLALVKAGLPVLRVWDLLIERAKHEGFQQALRMVRQDIRGGASASEALSRHPGYFSELYIATVRAGEQSGNLVEVLKRFIAYLKLMIGLRHKIGKALAYPAFLILTGIGVIGFLLSYVMPTFLSVYAESAKSLPVATQMLIDAAATAKLYIVPSLVLLTGLLLAARAYYATPHGRLTVTGDGFHQALHDPIGANAGNHLGRRDPSGRGAAHYKKRCLKPVHCRRIDGGGRRNPRRHDACVGAGSSESVPEARR